MIPPTGKRLLHGPKISSMNLLVSSSVSYEEGYPAQTKTCFPLIDEPVSQRSLLYRGHPCSYLTGFLLSLYS